MNERTQLFITTHIHDDVHQLALQAGRYPDVDMPLALRQITGTQKMELKVPFFAQNKDILYPERLSLEQASSETTARYKASLCKGKNFADLTGGMGIDTYFISHNFEKAEYVERQSELCALAQHNFKLLGADNIQVVHSTAEEYLNNMQPVDWIYIDPARRNESGKKLVLITDCSPDIKTLTPALLKKSKSVMIKLSPMLDISSTIQDIPNIHEIHILAIDNECKEILLIIKADKTNDIQIHTINFSKNKEKQLFFFSLRQENEISVEYTSTIKKYLYEPNAAIMKSGSFKLIGYQYELEKLHRNTHLYTSNNLQINFPGRIFEVLSMWGNSKKDWKKHLNLISSANISVRNYPLNAVELRKKLKLSEGGDCYLFACTLANNEKSIIECQKVSM